MEHLVSYSSRSLTKAERDYCVTRKELLAVVESVKHFRYYVHGQKFHIRTDHAPLHSVLKVKKPEAQLARWIEFLSPFEYEIEYREGQRQTKADAMPRTPCSEGCKWCKEWKKAEQLISVVVQTEIAISKTEEFAEDEADSTQVEKSDAEPSSATGEHCLPNDLPNPRCNTNKLEPTWTLEYLRLPQATDPSLKVILSLRNKVPSDQSGKTYPLMIRLSSHSGPSGNKGKSMIEYCVGDGRKEMAPGRRTRLYCHGICKRLHLRRIITTQLPAIEG